MKSFRTHYSMLLVLVFLTGCQEPSEPMDEGLLVAVAQVQSTPESPAEHYTGEVRPRHVVNSAFRVGGKVVDRLVEVGDRVQAGTELARLDTTDYQLAVEAAQAELESANAATKRASQEEKRIRDLTARSMVSQSEYELAKASADSSVAATRRAERMLELAKNRLEYCSLKAEFDSIVLSFPIEKGTVLPEGATAIQLARIGELEAVIDIPENRVESIKGLNGVVTLWANSKKSFEVKLREFSPNADPLTRTYRARYSILEPTEEVRIGMTATILFQSTIQESPYKQIPMTALFQNEGKPSVWIVDDAKGTLECRSVEVHQYGRDIAWIASGLAPGEYVVRAGVQKLDASMKVKVWEDTLVSSGYPVSRLSK